MGGNFIVHALVDNGSVGKSPSYRTETRGISGEIGPKRTMPCAKVFLKSFA